MTIFGELRRKHTLMLLACLDSHDSGLSISRLEHWSLETVSGHLVENSRMSCD